MNKIYINIFIIFIRIINFQINLTYYVLRITLVFRIENNYFQINNFILYKILKKVLYNENYET